MKICPKFSENIYFCSQVVAFFVNMATDITFWHSLTF